MLAVVFATLALACGEDRFVDWTRVVAGLRVTVTSGETGGPDDVLPIGSAGMKYTIDVEVESGSGDNVVPMDGWVRISARPGSLQVDPNDGTTGSDANGRYFGDIQLSGGRASGIRVTLTRAFGETRLWAEDLGFVPAPAGVKPACDNGVDDDLDGLTDAAEDPGCYDATDDSETGGTSAAGVSGAIVVDTPTLGQVQGVTTQASTTPYDGETVTVNHGFMVVTRVATDGMYITDVADPPGSYNSLFVFNFNTPAFTRVCDRILSVTGIMSEFYKFTEMSFPNWESDWWDPRKGPCPVPQPHVLTAADLASSKTMEGYEAALVEVRDVTLGDHDCEDADPNDGACYCDIDGNGSVDFIPFTPSEPCSDECWCRKSCENDPLCTDLSQYAQYDQWVVQVGSGSSAEKLLVVTAQSVPQFDPFAPGHPTRIASITGTLRNMSFLRPPWILEPRCPDDLVVEGTPKDIAERCVHARTGEELDEDK